MTYTPKPVDTSDIDLADDLAGLMEMLAENTHEVWARQRIAEGWSYGRRRDDAQKQHPCLVSYEELPESEKEYDRQTAAETLRLVKALGYHKGRRER